MVTYILEELRDVSKHALNATLTLSNYCLGGLVNNIFFDAFGNMALTCSKNGYIALYRKNGKSQNLQIATNSTPYASAVDSKGRYVVLDSYLEIYY